MSYVPDNLDIFEQHEAGCRHTACGLDEKLNGPGFLEIGTGTFVAEEDAYEYALERLTQDEDEKRKFVEWFFSGNWIKEE